MVGHPLFLAQTVGGGDKRMSKVGIRIIKRVNKTMGRAIETPAVSPISEKAELRNATDAVNIWISERRESRRVEKTASDRSILAWRDI